MNSSTANPWVQVFGFSVLDNVPVGSCVLNSKFEVVFWNKVLEKWTGIDRWEILQKNLGQFFPHLAQSHYQLRLDSIFQGGPPLVLSSQLHGQIIPATCADGQAMIQQTTVTGIPVHDGTGCLACMAVEDVSEVTRRIIDLKETRDRAKRLAKKAHQANEAKSQFLANMSHELRTPLNSILLMSKILGENREQTLSGSDIKSVQTIIQSGTALLDLVEDILDFSRTEAGQTKVKDEVVDLESIIEEVNNTFGLLVTHKGLDFVLEVEKGVPAQVMSDGQALLRIIGNLVGNAAKFTEQGKVVLSLERVTPEPDEHGVGPMLRISVADTGPGVSLDRQERIFESFQQEDGTISRKFGGTGLGLAISRALSELLGGSLELVSQPGHGCTFSLCLPLVAVGEAQLSPRTQEINNFSAMPNSDQETSQDRYKGPAVSDPQSTGEYQPDQLAGIRILLADIDMRSIFTISGILEGAGAVVHTATDATAAVQKWNQNEAYDLVLYGLIDPATSASEEAAGIREKIQSSAIPFVCMSGAHEEQHCQNKGACPASGVLTKPFSQQELIQVVEQSLLVETLC